MTDANWPEAEQPQSPSLPLGYRPCSQLCPRHLNALILLSASTACRRRWTLSQEHGGPDWKMRVAYEQRLQKLRLVVGAVTPAGKTGPDSASRPPAGLSAHEAVRIRELAQGAPRGERDLCLLQAQSLAGWG